MENKGLLFIPDISGFTQFVTNMEIEHSRHIIQELLEILIDSNQLGLEVSEVEGDAILFYKFGSSPDLDAIYKQVEKMFCAFHRHLQAYESRRFCQCKACVTAINLSLKVITHYGEFTGYTVKNFYKLIGKDVIVAHQLLKNDIEQHEYWLVTKDLVPQNQPSGFTQWMEWNSSAKKVENGEIPFHYTQLSPLKKELPPETPPQLEITNKVKVLSFSKEYDTSIKKLFYTIGHFELRNRWEEGVKQIDEVDHFLPGVGTRHRCVLDNGQVIMYSSSFMYDPEHKIIFSETDEDKKGAVYSTLENKGVNKTLLTIDIYIKRNIFFQIMFKLVMKKKMKARFEKSLSNLEGLLKEVELPVEF
jgi:hypothetical protein